MIYTGHKHYELEKRRLVELERPTAYHAVTVFPPHTLRCEVILGLPCLSQT